MGEGVRTTASGMAVFCGKFRIVERVKGIEPSSSAWEAAALPLSYTRKASLQGGAGGWQISRERSIRIARRRIQAAALFRFVCAAPLG